MTVLCEGSALGEAKNLPRIVKIVFASPHISPDQNGLNQGGDLRHGRLDARLYVAVAFTPARS